MRSSSNRNNSRNDGTTSALTSDDAAIYHYHQADHQQTSAPLGPPIPAPLGQGVGQGEPRSLPPTDASSPSIASNATSAANAAVGNHMNRMNAGGAPPSVHYDPYGPVPVGVSLLDDAEAEAEEEEEEVANASVGAVRAGSALQGGDFLELEIPYDDDNNDEEGEMEVVFEAESTTVEAPAAWTTALPGPVGVDNDRDKPIQTDSGLLLTHRKTPQHQKHHHRSSSVHSATTVPLANSSSSAAEARSRVRSRHGFASSPNGERGVGRLELEHEWYLPSNDNSRDFDADDHHHSRRPSPRPGSVAYYQPYARAAFRSSGGGLTLRRWLSYARGGVILMGVALLAGAGVVLRHARHETSSSSSTTTTDHTPSTAGSGRGGSRVISLEEDQGYDAVDVPDRIILLPLPEDALVEDPYHQHHPNQHQQHPYHPYQPPNDRFFSSRQQHHHRDHVQQHQNHHQQQHRRHLLTEVDHQLHHLFAQWKQDHNKQYQSHAEHRQRFHIWRDNHRRVQERNERHGPCQLTGQPVFGLNHLSDLDPDEFQQHYLSGYGVAPPPTAPTRPVLDPDAASDDHKATVVQHHRRMTAMESDGSPHNHYFSVEPAKQTSWESCQWYDVSCYLRYIFETYFYGLGRTMEPIYDADSYPMAVDWRQVGAVTDVHSQSSCGACWAITAVETIESASFLGGGQDQLLDLSETEVIVCADECQMCSGGWPQNAFEYVMDHKGIPLESELPYNADYLLQLTEALESGDADGTLKSYSQTVCPSGNGGGGGHSGDNKNENNGGSGSSSTRYGNIKGYGYATEKCVCYTDGSGCDCDSQNEGLAVRNVATYGPAVVCVDASTWQDYKGGIMTSESGCSRKFLDVNHCVQVVGYAFATADGSGGEGGEGEQQRNSHSGDGGGGGSRDNADRVGYWIVRNQWSSYWGMNGYAYVAMGENTCGILNDMIQVYS